MGAFVYWKNKELESETRMENMETRKCNMETRKDLHQAIAEMKMYSAENKSGRVRSEETQRVVEELSKMKDIDVLDKIKVAEKMVKNQVITLVFLSGTDDEKKMLVRALLNEQGIFRFLLPFFVILCLYLFYINIFVSFTLVAFVFFMFRVAGVYIRN